MCVPTPPYRWENKLQASLLGVDEEARMEARQLIQDTISTHHAVIYTYGLSPFSSEALAVMDEVGLKYHRQEIGLEWFLLGRRASALRLELLEMTGQSSLPHVFIDGKHIGGLFSGSPTSDDEARGGVAALKESGELAKIAGLSTEVEFAS